MFGGGLICLLHVATATPSPIPHFLKSNRLNHNKLNFVKFWESDVQLDSRLDFMFANVWPRKQLAWYAYWLVEHIEHSWMQN